MPGVVFIRPRWHFVRIDDSDVLHIAETSKVLSAVRELGLRGFVTLCSDIGELSFIAKQSWEDDVLCAECWKLYRHETREGNR